ncbi:undecaprenyldiphospho-muramoylpentapeptide beta-N-acetylglucosaminyltransferase [Acetobacteraceae bacterium]|nr:undecaprenyldiphospho-muramoylpentapeptide beta-N-acetylglucosaminyltransferase [Acetobacteraceae bacterium]
MMRFQELHQRGTNTVTSHSSSHNIILAAGGTGGHLFPAMSLGKTLEEKGYTPIFLIDKRAEVKFQEKNASDWSFFVIKSGGIVGKNLFTRMKGALQLLLGTIQAAFILRRLKPDAVIGFGGYPSLPPLLAARLPFFKKTIPLVHEGNAVAGTANRLLARLGARVCLSFPETKGFSDNAASEYIGMPIRPELDDLSNRYPYIPPSTTGEIHLLIVGGSLGASVFSTLIPQALEALPNEIRSKIYISQQASEDFIPQLTEKYNKLGIHIKKIVPFFHDMIEQISEAHLLISRSGGGTVAEVIAADRPAIFIPLPTAAADEQTVNANFLVKNQAAWLIPQRELSENPQQLTVLLKEIFENTQILAQTADHLKILAAPKATERFTDYIISLISHSSNPSE